MNTIKKTLKNKKGFTLVEILVVLIILAILAAVSIPSMLGFVNDAKGKAVIAEARAAYVAAQYVATEEHAENDTFNANTITNTTAGVVALLSGEVTGTFTTTSAETPNIGKVASIIYINDGYTVTITAGGNADVVKN